MLLGAGRGMENEALDDGGGTRDETGVGTEGFIEGS
jgi:hypothetical protein